MASHPYKKGQRWASTPEPELGLGTIVQVSDDRIHVLYPATGELRMYSPEGAPLRRVSFEPGDDVLDHDGKKFHIESVRDEDGVLTYVGKDGELPEASLNDHIQASGPMDRLLGGHVDEGYAFQLRHELLEYLHGIRKSPAKGFVGGRIDLIPHQLHVAKEVCRRMAPRVMLSDEVGLGKTIEACLILHRLHLSGRAQRVLILVPDSLVHQWFVEMLRKFNLWMHIYDLERCESLEDSAPDNNPFLDEQWILCSLDFLIQHPDRAKQAMDATWDLLVVDEAHHLTCEDGDTNPAYGIVENLARQTEGLLLLTATPEQLGFESHIARLRLLDPERYEDLDSLNEQASHYAELAPIATSLGEGIPPSPEQIEVLTKLPGMHIEGQSPAEILSDLLDRHGPGRVIFRNTRASIPGFPGRKAKLIPLRPDRDEDEIYLRTSREFEADAGLIPHLEAMDLSRDPRATWIAKWLEDNPGAKLLIICTTKEKALALEEALRQVTSARCSIFHEGLTLVQRDRNAAWFAEEDGARILICSEIGSEGRNFQFVHHLLLFDLPLNPELLEQRIGRLDRIGQKSTIQILVPYLRDSAGEVLAHWYHHGLNAFEDHVHGGIEIMQKFGKRLVKVCLDPEDTIEWRELIDHAATARKAIAHELEIGRDRLLELNSHNPDSAEELSESIRNIDKDPRAEQLLLDILDLHGINPEEIGDRTYLFDSRKMAENEKHLPGLPDQDRIGTFDRRHALGREDIDLLTVDHPIFTGVSDWLLGGELGNSSFGVWPVTDGQTSLMLEVLYVLETQAPPHLHADRFLPHAPILLLVNQQGERIDIEIPKLKENVPPHRLLDAPSMRQKILPFMEKKARAHAQKKAQVLIAEASRDMGKRLQAEIDRLLALQEVNHHIRADEIRLAREQKEQLSTAIEEATLRLDAVRLIYKGSPEML
jgi:ATP-dependent helicase HepA